MKISLVIASINELENLKSIKDDLNRKEIGVIVVDEGNLKVRRRNKKYLNNLSVEFYGPRERCEWFKKHFGSGYRKNLSIIPEKCHAETSFGFLVAYEEQADVIIEMDDDVFPWEKSDIIEGHLKNLSESEGFSVSSDGKWYNTLENMTMDNSANLFPRGHPYALETRGHDYVWERKCGESVLNMGLWNGQLDLDALTIINHGGLDGRCRSVESGLKRNKVFVEKGNYFAICSMNTSLVRNIIPAFYQLYMNHLGINRFDDIWSGIFLKKISDKLQDNITLGAPIIFHDKRHRDVFKDLRAELEGLIINETLWRVIDSIELNCKNYYEGYSGIIKGIEKNLHKFTTNVQRDFIKLQINKMDLWLKILEKLG